MSDMAIYPRQVREEVVVELPGSKSLTNRALVVSALADGVSILEGIGLGEDTRLMIGLLSALGIRVQLDETARTVRVEGCGGHLPEQEADLFCGNAGTVMRFGTALCCLGYGRYRLDGVERMRHRPIGPLVDALRDLGAQIGYEGRSGFPPVTILARGLRGGQVAMRGDQSSQFVSAVLMVSPYAKNDVMLELLGRVVSRPYIRMTLQVMDDFGIGFVERDLQKFIVPAMQTYHARRYAVEPDASAASYFFAAAALAGTKVVVRGLGSRSVQGDVGFVRILEQMGCCVQQEPDVTAVIGPSDGTLHGVDVDLNDMPDVAQTLAVLGLFADSPTTIRNVANLRIKETDRLAALATELQKFGADVEQYEDGLTVHPPAQPRPATVDTYRDHRMAMSFALAGMRIPGVVIRDVECVDKTFPDFFKVFAEFAECRPI